jgi:HAD superfamily hydrolase (TIGR01549 family)
MLTLPPEGAGTYLCYYFNPQYQYTRIVRFNINLFECLCAADHGMTLGYKKSSSGWTPAFEKGDIPWQALQQISVCTEYAGRFAKSNECIVDARGLDTITHRLLTRLMSYPTRDEATCFGSFPFWDDAIVGITMPLAQPVTWREYYPFSCVYKIKTWFRRGRLAQSVHSKYLFWKGGSFALSRRSLAFFMRKDSIAYDLLFWIWKSGNARQIKKSQELCRKRHLLIENVIKDMKNSFDIISFDVFDTLISRKVRKPTDVFSFVEANTDNKGFAEERIDAEQRTRSKLPPNREDVTLEHIYDELRFSDKNRLIDAEIEVEYDVCQRNNNGFALYKEAISRGSRIIAVSDMYLPSDIISRILQNAGYMNIECVYVSGEIGVAKGSGNLFRHVLKEEGVESEKVIHIGDNLASDVKGARKARIQGYLFPTRQLRSSLTLRKIARYIKRKLLG